MHGTRRPHATQAGRAQAPPAASDCTRPGCGCHRPEQGMAGTNRRGIGGDGTRGPHAAQRTVDERNDNGGDADGARAQREETAQHRRLLGAALEQPAGARQARRRGGAGCGCTAGVRAGEVRAATQCESVAPRRAGPLRMLAPAQHLGRLGAPHPRTLLSSKRAGTTQTVARLPSRASAAQRSTRAEGEASARPSARTSRRGGRGRPAQRRTPEWRTRAPARSRMLRAPSRRPAAGAPC